MRINCINPISNTKSNTKDINFESKRQIYKIKRASIQELESRAVYEKASEWLNILPKGKMEKTVICNVNGKKYGFRWDTKNEDNLILKIKDNIESSDTIEWNKNKDNQSVLELFFDKNGIMRSGNITKKLKDTYSLNALYLRDNNNVKISRQIEDLAYKILKTKEEYISKNYKEPTNEEISKLLKNDTL